jgi:hypothetical protein
MLVWGKLQNIVGPQAVTEVDTEMDILDCDTVQIHR